MDLNMPSMGGVEATRHIAEVSPLTRVVMLTISDEDSDVTDAILAGACGYLLKDASIQELVAGIRAAARGDARGLGALEQVLGGAVGDVDDGDILAAQDRQPLAVGRECQVVGAGTSRLRTDAPSLVRHTIAAVRASTPAQPAPDSGVGARNASLLSAASITCTALGVGPGSSTR